MTGIMTRLSQYRMRLPAVLFLTGVLTPACTTGADPAETTDATMPMGSAPDQSSNLSSPGAVDGPVLMSPSPESTQTRTSMNAEIAGTVVFDAESNCLYLENDGFLQTVIWPGGSSWQSDPPRIELSDGQIVEAGMYVSGGGGGISFDRLEGIAGSDVAGAARSCTGTGDSVSLFNIGEGWQISVTD